MPFYFQILDLDINLEVKPTPPKRLKSLDIQHCVICSEKFDKRNPDLIVRNPTKEGLNTLVAASEIRKDEVFHRLQSMKENILNENIQNIAFHKKCRATYTSKSNLKYIGADGENRLLSLPVSRCAEFLVMIQPLLAYVKTALFVEKCQNGEKN